MNTYLAVLKNYADFKGRASRREFWMFALVNIIIAVVLNILWLIPDVGMVFGGLAFLYWLLIIIPSLAVTVRRLHDTGRSGWWLLIGFIPFIGAIVLLVFYVLDSQAGDNQYGPNPKGVPAVAA